MALLEYPLSHPYPKERTFVTVVSILILLLLPLLVLINIVTAGYELVPVLRPDFGPNNTVPSWMNMPRLPPILRRDAPPCEPKDFGRGDIIRLSSSLFEYKILSAWRNSTARDPEDEARVEYRGGSFEQCYTYGARFDYSLVDWTQTVTVAIYCPDPMVNTFMETAVRFADDITKDVVGQYYGYNIDLFQFVDKASRNYRKAVFGVLDAISTDSLIIMSGQYLSSPVVSLSTSIDQNKDFSFTYVTYMNGTVEWVTGNTLGSAEIYRDTILNLISAVTSAVGLDLGHTGPNNFFINASAVRDAFLPNLAPDGISPDKWLFDSSSFYYGKVVPPYQTWAQMLLAGKPGNITLGNLTGLPNESTMVTNYLCPSYQVKPMSSFLASIFIGTATMYLSAWGAWAFITAIIARKMRTPCVQCVCHSGEQQHVHTGEVVELSHSDEAPALVPATSRAESVKSDPEKDKRE